MKCQAITCLALVALASAADPSKDDDSPVTRVVNMLSELQGQIVADGKAESQTYNKYACWCETSTKRKANDITTAETELRSLGQQILKLKGKVATLAAEIAEAATALEENNKEQEESTAVRQKQNGEFMAMQAETKEALSAMETAIGILSTGSEQKEDTRATRTSMLQESTSAVQMVVDKIPSMAPLKVDSISVLSAFIQNGADAQYAPQSATIQGILGDMYTTFATNLEDATMTEAKQNTNYEKLTHTLENEAADLNKLKSRKEGEKADAESDLADTTSTYDETTDQMKADIKFFDQTKDACDAKHSEWELRGKMRDEELKGIEKALGFLSSDAARDLFAKSIKPGVEAASFLQIAADDAKAVSFKAYSMIKTQATKSKSFRLAALAVSIRTAKVGHFDAVIKAIDNMMGTLNDEGDADRAKRNQCNDEYQDVAKTVADLDWKLKNNDAKIDKLESLIEMRTQERQETIDQIGETTDYIKKIGDDRKESHQNFQNAKKDDENAIALLNKALDAFSSFYKKNDISFVQADPAFEVSEDQAPDAVFSDKGNRKGQSKGVVSMLTMIIQDLEDEVTNGRADEAKSQAAYEAELATAEALKKDLESKKSNLKDIIAKRNQEKTEENTDRNSNNKDRDAELAYKAKIAPDCDWIKANFAGRATARSAEMEGLVSAKEFLAGKSALLQLKKDMPVKEHKEGLASLNFLGVQ